MDVNVFSKQFKVQLQNKDLEGPKSLFVSSKREPSVEHSDERVDFFNRGWEAPSYDRWEWQYASYDRCILL